MQRLLPATTTLLVVDLQERLIPAIDPTAMERALRGVGILLEAARVLSIPTLATEQYPKGLGVTVPTVQQGLDAIGVTPVHKTLFSAAEVPEIARAIAHSAPRAVIVVGLEAHVCIYQTVRDLRARGLEVHVPYDAVASRRQDDHRVGLDQMSRAGAVITSAETVAFDLLREASGDAFKALSKRIK